MIKLSKNMIYAPRQYDLGIFNKESAGLTDGAPPFANGGPSLYRTRPLRTNAGPVGELPVSNMLGSVTGGSETLLQSVIETSSA